ncbi:ABC transporter substrate-binding protein [Bradyrhizobium guangxiense]|uniref:ABC transporter substrate-binding protein n=1 Tax=Bradyrhizobium guangxiense TaxID=1325115 RepID=UPI0013E8AFD3|nr:ABC transporter substrate-binding protein [Bradyrhizobium guangxiense]
MRRRDFIGIAAAMAAGLPLSVRAVSPRNARVGFLTLGADRSPLVDGRVASFREGVIGRGQDAINIEVLERRANGQIDRLAPMAADLVGQGVQAICAISPPAVRAARQATAAIPIVALDLESDPVASAWAASLAHPGGNVTGIFLDIPGFNAKTLQLLSEIVPGIRSVAVLWHRPSGSLQLGALRGAAASLGVTLDIFEVDSVGDLGGAIAAMAKSDVKGVIMLSSSLFAGNLGLLADLTLRHRLPAINTFPEFAASGGLLGYGPDLPSLFTQAGFMTRKVLQGSSVAELPIERPTRFQLIANTKTATALNLTLPASILVSADSVIE